MSAPSDATQRFGSQTDATLGQPKKTITLPRGDKVVIGNIIQDGSTARSILFIRESIPETRHRLWRAVETTLNQDSEEAASIRIRLEQLPRSAGGKVTCAFLMKHLERQIGPLSITESDDGTYYDVYLHLCKPWVRSLSIPSTIYIGRIECKKYLSSQFLRHF